MTLAAIDTTTVHVPDADPDARYRRIASTRHFRGVTSFREPLVKATATLRNDPLGQMYSRRQIGRAQYEAGRKYQATREAMGIGTGRSPSDIREWVDGGQIASDGITDERLRAAKDIAKWRALLGTEGYKLIEAVLIDKATIRQYADASPMMSGKAATTYYGHAFRIALTTLAKAMGLAS